MEPGSFSPPHLGGPGGSSVSFTYDALSRRLTETGAQGTTTSDYDAAGRRTKLTYPGTGLYLNHDYYVTGEVRQIRENGATSGIGLLAVFKYDNLGNRTQLLFGNGTSQDYGYDPVGRLASLTANLNGTADDLTIGAIAYNPASQIMSLNRSNDSYAWNGHHNENNSYTANGLNQFSSTGMATPTYDSKGNLNSAGSTTYTYNSENMLTAATGGISLTYDPLLRLSQVSGPSSNTKFAYDGLRAIAEYDGSNALQRRFVFGPGLDEAVVQYEGSGTTTRRFLHADERGSIVAVSDATGAVFAKNTYDEYGIPGSGNYGRFQYTGQMWLPELGLYHYKARTYAPTLGRFLQTDPIGYGDGPNWYNYVGGDPVNFVDPLGLGVCIAVRKKDDECDTILVTGKRNKKKNDDGNSGGSTSPAQPRPGAPSGVAGGITGGPRVGGNRRGDQGSEEEEDNSCDDALEEEGVIRVDSVDVRAVVLGGLAYTTGRFTNLRTGTTGGFRTVGGGVGLDIGFSVNETYYTSLANFVGYGESLSGGIGFSGFGTISLSRAQNVNNQTVGYGASYAPPTPVGLGRLGGSGVASDTQIFGCSAGG